MLKGIPHLLDPGLLHSLASMGHGDTIAIVDANFPATAIASRLHHSPGLSAGTMLDAILQVLPLDTFVSDPACTMQQVDDAASEPPAVADLNAVLRRYGASPAATLERFAF